MNKRRRSAAKALTWRMAATTDTVIIAWIITGKFTVGLTIGGIEVFTKMFLYYVHERIWDRLKYGRHLHPRTA